MITRSVLAAMAVLLSVPDAGLAAATVFFNESQIAQLVATGTTSDTIISEGYLFTYTRDKLFTGGVGLTNPIGRYIRVPWPQGVEAQAVTAGPNPGGAKITIRRVDGGLFDFPAFTAKLLANTAGAGGSIEIMPKSNGEDARNDPFYYSASGNYGMSFSYDTSTPGYLGNTASLTNYEAYVISLYVDFALTALVFESIDPSTTNHVSSDILISGSAILENEASGTWIGTLSTIDQDVGDSFTYTLVSGAGDNDNGSFYLIDGDLYSIAPFNYELQSNLSIRVESSDQGSLTAEKVFAISVLDVFEPPPEFSAPPVFSEGNVVITWDSIASHTYSMYESTNMMEGFHLVDSGIPATPPMNVFTGAVDAVESGAWMIITDP